MVDTIKGVTRYGFHYEIPRARIDDMELYEKIAAMDDSNVLEVVEMIRVILGDELKKAMYDSVRTPAGNVPVEAALNSLYDILGGVGAGVLEEEDGKNVSTSSQPSPQTAPLYTATSQRYTV